MSIKRILSFIFYPLIDLWDDCKTLKAIFQGKAKMKIKPEEIFKDIDVTFKENYVWFLLLILALLSGFFLSGKYYQNQCNNFIVDNYGEELNTMEDKESNYTLPFQEIIDFNKNTSEVIVADYPDNLSD